MTNKFRHAVVALACVMTAFGAFAQTAWEEIQQNPNKSGGVYYAYPAAKADNTPAPKGYTPFYISHYGRHGSRYLISDSDYTGIASLMHRADTMNALTPLGRDVMHRIDSLMIETAGRGGDLSPLGVRQHRGIAERMYCNYPQVFKDSAEISARSTIVVRCVLSMDAFCERLKELNPKLKTTRESSGRYMNYMNYHSPESNEFTGKNGYWHEEYRKFEEKNVKGDRMAQSLFSDPVFIDRYVNPTDLMWSLYWLASDMQNVETKLDFYDIFTPEELFGLWQSFNYRFYVCDANYKGNKGMMLANARPLVRNVIESADAAIASPKPSATLRFGHDGNLIPFAGILGIEGCDNSVENPEDFKDAFVDYRIAPMAGNIQLVFFRNPKKGNADSDILVKILHNEKEVKVPVKTDIWPYYRWSDLKSYLKTR